MISGIEGLRITKIRGFKKFLTIVKKLYNVEPKHERVSNKPNWSVYYCVYVEPKIYDQIYYLGHLYNSTKQNRSYINVYKIDETTGMVTG